MGIRIHKVLGYGFKSIAHKDIRFNESFWALNDDYIDIKPLLIKECEDSKDNVSKDPHNNLAFFRQWITNTGWHEKGGCDHDKLYISDFFCYSGYAAESNKFPVIFSAKRYNKDWYRYDDIIDYIEAGRTMKDSVKLLNGGIYPHLSKVDIRTGKILTDKEIENIDPQYIANDIAPEILVFCRALNVFKDPLSVYKLKPMLYTYWS